MSRLITGSTRSVVKTFRNRVRSVALRGRAVQCPLCDGEFRHWIGKRNNGRCPGCISATRTRILALLLDERRELLGDGRVLHFAPEPRLRSRVRPSLGGRYVSTDLRRADVTTRQDITAMTFADGDFTGIICSHVLEHIPDDRLALRELARVLAPGGYLIVQVPLSLDRPTDEDESVTEPAERNRRWGEPDHLRKYGLDIVERIEAAGLEVDTKRCSELFDDARRARHGLAAEQVVFLARKP